MVKKKCSSALQAQFQQAAKTGQKAF